MMTDIKYAYFKNMKLSKVEFDYIIYHTPRYEYVLDTIKRLIKLFQENNNIKEKIKIIDLGPHFLTQIIRNDTDTIVNQLGWRYDEISKLRKGEIHFDFDLNRTPDKSTWPAMEPNQIMVACEIIEHLYTSPNYVLPFLHSCIDMGGYLIIGTPNAVSLKHRIVMLTGKNPFELIREILTNPGHFREYTKDEIVNYAANNGFKLVNFGCHSYYNYINHGLIGKTYKLLSKILPFSLRDNMTFVFQKVK